MIHFVVKVSEDGEIEAELKISHAKLGDISRLQKCALIVNSAGT
jgi:hypothetical protein